jgi:spectinomycin phosphotransferase
VAYVALGYGSHNWDVLDADGRRWFVKANRSGADSVFFQATYRTTLALHRAGLEFVHAALPDRSGDPKPSTSSGWDLAVFPFIDGRSPDWNSTAERALVAETVGRLHAAGIVPTEALRWEPGWKHPELRRLMEESLDDPWTAGPFGERARLLIRKDRAAIHQLFDHFDRLLAEVLADPEPWVMTHGEPHGGNSMIDRSGALHLIDCDAVMVAPRERDLRILLYGGHQVGGDVDEAVLAGYQCAAGPVRPRTSALELFRAEWHLAEISGYATALSGEHTEDANYASYWKYLQVYVPVSQNWPGLRSTGGTGDRQGRQTGAT